MQTQTTHSTALILTVLTFGAVGLLQKNYNFNIQEQRQKA